MSHGLTAAQVASLHAAAQHADRIGLPLNRMITIHWSAAGVTLAGMAKATGRFVDLLSKAMARQGHRTAWIWVHENGDRKGGHAHLLVHVPAHLVPKLAALQRGWLRRITARPYRVGVIHSRPIGGRLGIELGNPDLYAVNLQAALAYCLKGVCSDDIADVNPPRHEPGGLVVGKRCGSSQNIGRAAQTAATGLDPLRSTEAQRE